MVGGRKTSLSNECSRFCMLVTLTLYLYMGKGKGNGKYIILYTDFFPVHLHFTRVRVLPFTQGFFA